MGVSIVAYSHLELTEPHPFDDDCYDNDHLRTFAYTGFEQSMRGLADHDRQFREGRIGGRCYAETPETEEHRIGDWSYTGYGKWREGLCHAVHGVQPRQVWETPDVYRSLPFFELINFADNEGCIGPDAARDLLADFTDHAPTPAHLDRVDDWVEGLRLAADGGLVQYR